MYPMPTPQIPPFAPYSSPMTQGLLQGGMRQLSSLPLQQGLSTQSGGFLSKLLGGAQAGGGGITNIVNMLQNAQKAIGVFQSVGPMVQQYAPLVKSLPAIIGMMKGSGNTEEQTTEEKISEQNNSDKKEEIIKTNKKKSNSDKIKQKKLAKKTSKSVQATSTKQKKIKHQRKTDLVKGIPAPKLYI